MSHPGLKQNLRGLAILSSAAIAIGSACSSHNTAGRTIQTRSSTTPTTTSVKIQPPKIDIAGIIRACGSESFAREIGCVEIQTGPDTTDPVVAGIYRAAGIPTDPSSFDRSKLPFTPLSDTNVAEICKSEVTQTQRDLCIENVAHTAGFGV